MVNVNRLDLDRIYFELVAGFEGLQISFDWESSSIQRSFFETAYFVFNIHIFFFLERQDYVPGGFAQIEANILSQE